ncbi:MAG: hypothetical protein SFU56_19975 [Capsulimonadales bacterium]|nr:hypothetical protein [Capsulimonadales bacterium]
MLKGKVLVAVACVCLFPMAVVHQVTSALRTEADREVRELQEASLRMEKDGVMSAPDYFRLSRIVKDSEPEDGKTPAPISTDDLEFVLRNCSAPALKSKNAEARVIRNFRSLDVLSTVLRTHRTGAPQRKRIFTVVSRIMTGHSARNARDGLIPTFCIGVFRALGDRRAIPLLVPHLKDRRSDVATLTRTALAELGYRSKKGGNRPMIAAHRSRSR